MHSRPSLRLIAAVLLFSPLSFAGVITGRVVDFNGVGVANVNINAEYSSGSGGHPTLLNDGTDANGFFTTTITPDGIFDISFLPPPPPATTHLVKTLSNVPVVGTVGLGTIVLPRGYALLGRIANPSGIGVANVNVDALEASGDPIVLQNDLTDALGAFRVAVPLGDLTLRFDATAVVGQTLVSAQIEQHVAGTLDIGTLGLANGFTLSGTVKRTNLVAVPDVDLDVYDSATGLELFTPADNTNALGAFSIVVPAGIHDIRFCPPFAQLLVAREFVDQAIGGNTNLGTVILQNGVVLSGTVQAFNGLKYPDVDVDVSFSGSNTHVVLCNDNTSSTGTYQVVIPTGTFDVRFTPPYALPLASQFVDAVVVATNKVVNGTLPSCPFYSNSGAGTPGSGGFIPQLSATGGAPRLGNPDYALALTNGLGGAQAAFIWTPAVQIAGPFNGSYLGLAGGYRVITLSGVPNVAGDGSGSVSVPIGSQAVLHGLALRARAFVLDRAAAGARAITPFLDATLLL